MSYAEVNRNLRQCFSQRVSPATHVPMELTEEEVSQLLQIAPVNMILHSFTRFSNWLQRKKTEGKHINRENMLKALFTTLQRVKSDSGRDPWKQRKASMKPQRSAQQDSEQMLPNSIKSEQVLTVREEFQRIVVGDDSWTLTDEQAAQYLKQYDLDTILRVFGEMGQTFPVAEFENGLDLLDWKLSVAN